MNLRYEFFDTTPTLFVGGNVTPPVQMVCRPLNYKGISADGGVGSIYYPQDTAQELTLSDFPICSWSTNTYSTWVAQSLTPIVANTMFDLATGNPAAIASGILDTVAESYSASIKADTFHGNTRAGSVNVAIQTQTIYKRRVHVTAEYARIIDDYFTKFGYAVEKLMVPDRHARVKWTFIKTRACIITGNCPSDAIRRVQNLYDRGLTWWAAWNDVGNYANPKENEPT